MKRLAILLLAIIGIGTALTAAAQDAQGPPIPTPPPDLVRNPNEPAPVYAAVMTDMTAGGTLEDITIKWKADVKGEIAGWIVEYTAPSSIQGQMAPHRKMVDKAKREATISDFLLGRMYIITVMPYGKNAKGEMQILPMKDPRAFGFRTGAAAKTLHPPKKLVAVADGTRALVSWEPTPDANAIGYQIFRKGPDDQSMKLYATLAIDDKTPVPVSAETRKPLTSAGPSAFIDSGLKENQTYEYAVRTYTSGAPPQYSETSGSTSIITRPFVATSRSLLIVYNARSKAGADIAAHYIQTRHLEKVAGVKVAVPPGAEISRADYQKLLLKPIQDYISIHPEVTTILLIRGIPWRIAESPQGAKTNLYLSWDRASVDSELTLARFDDYPIEGRLQNPLYGKSAHVTPVDRVIAVCRLDGPDDDEAKALVDKAIDAEKHGIDGIAFFDARGLKTGSYMEGDIAIRKAADLMKQDGRMKVELEDTAENIDLSTKQEKIGFYYGWYVSSWHPKNKSFRFGRGAIGAHLHSYAGTSISADKYWVGEMIDHGATAVLGVATEPLLDGFPTADALTDALLKGCNFSEASLSASRYLSWMPMAIGDPLYRPFKPPKEAKEPAAPARGARRSRRSRRRRTGSRTKVKNSPLARMSVGQAS